MMDRRAVWKFNLLSAHSEVFPPRQASLLPIQLLKPFAMYQVEIAAITVLLTASHCTHKKQKIFFCPIAFNPTLYLLPYSKNKSLCFLFHFSGYMKISKKMLIGINFKRKDYHVMANV